MTHHLLSFEVPMEPLGWQRSGYARGVIYKPKRLRDYQKVIGTYASRAMRSRAPYGGPLRVDFTFLISVPASFSKMRRQAALAGETAPEGKPDRDNLEKAVADACNKIVWADDAQIVDGRTRKLWGEGPLVRVEVALAVSSRQRIVQELANRILRTGQLL